MILYAIPWWDNVIEKDTYGTETILFDRRGNLIDENSIAIRNSQIRSKQYVKYKNILGDNARFLLNYPPTEMNKVYMICDIFVLGSINEPFGIVFLEAMASGKPVIGHNFPVTKWIIGNGGTVDDLTAEGKLSGIIKKYLTHEELKLKHGTLARRRTEEQFSWSVLVDKYREMYNSILFKRD